MDTSIVPENNNDDQLDHTKNSLEDQVFSSDADVMEDDTEDFRDPLDEMLDRDEDSFIEHLESVRQEDPNERGSTLTRIQADLLSDLSNYAALPPINQVRMAAVTAYLGTLDRDAYQEVPELPPEEKLQQREIDAQIERELLWLSNGLCTELNRYYGVKPTESLPSARFLPPSHIAALLSYLYTTAEITPGGLELDGNVGILSVYQQHGEHAGIYRRADAGFLERAAQRFHADLDAKGYKEVERLVRLHAPKVEENADEDVLFMSNGIYNYRTDERMAFTPELVRTAKIARSLPTTRPPVPRVLDENGNELWELERWMTETFPNEGTRHALWQILGMSVRPLVDWQKMPCLYNESGSNGKGTFLDMIEAINGSANTAHVSLESYDSQFGASSLIGKRLNLVHEVSVNQFMKKVDKLKAIITNDPIEIDRKHKDPISYKPQLVNIVALNGALQFGDKTASMERRVMILPMDMEFKDGQKNEAIKKDYVKRREVSEYILYKVLVEMPKYWKLTIPESAKAAMDAHRLETNKVAAFVHAFQHEFERPFLPLTMLRDLYMAWLKRYNPASKPVSAPAFNKEIQALFDDKLWFIPTNDKGDPRKFGVSSWLRSDEPVLDEFGSDREVDKWRFFQRYSQSLGGAQWALGDNLPRQARGFMRRDFFGDWEAAGSPVSDAAIRDLFQKRITDAAVAATSAHSAATPTPQTVVPTAVPVVGAATRVVPENESTAEKVERLKKENDAMRNASVPSTDPTARNNS